MARRIRLDAPGAAHHVMVRGIDGERIFRDPDDYQDFVDRFVRILPLEGAPCFAWALMPNHGHFVIRTNEGGLSRIMRRLNTSYAQRFNRRWARRGYLFQNRFRSRLVTDDADLMGLVRYVHLNPLEAGLAPSLAALERFPWCGHGALMGSRPGLPFEAVADTLALFAEDVATARRRLRQWMAADASERHVDPTAAPAAESPPRFLAPGFEAEGTIGLEALLAAARRHYGVREDQLRSGRKKPEIVRVRAVVAYWAVVHLRIPTAPVAAALGISPSTVSACVDRGRGQSRADAFHPF
jgi:REP element-mobilizing transposase RayT